MKKTLLVVFTKAPIPGKCKSRLSESRNNNAHWAATVSACLIEKMQDEHLDRNNYDTMISVSQASDISLMKKLFTHQEYHVQPQHENLGARMSETIEAKLSEYDNVIIIGSDCPDVSHATINQAIAALQTKDIVLGPATDGGFYLIGMNKHADVFDGVEYSTGRELEQTINKINENGLDHRLLDTLTDIDHYSDFENWYRSLTEKHCLCWMKKFDRMKKLIK